MKEAVRQVNKATSTCKLAKGQNSDSYSYEDGPLEILSVTKPDRALAKGLPANFKTCVLLLLRLIWSKTGRKK